MNKDVKQSHDPSRRDFFNTVALASLAPFVPLSIVSCGDDLPTFVGTGKAPFKVWEEMIQAVMTSPDYLPGRMERLITSKDLQAMYHFVRDEIILVPNRPKSIWGMGREMKWGLEGVMRCGMATPREKAELLNKMYLDAGIQSKVVFETTDFTTEEVPALFLRPVEREFAPKISKKQLRNWKKEMGDSTERFAGKEIKKDFREESKEIGQKAIGALNNDGDWGESFDFRWDNGRNPTVEFEQDGVVKYAHLFDPNTTFGALRNPKLGVRKATPPIENEEKIDLKISVRTSIAHKEEVEIIAGEWKASDLVGKQLALQFLHGLTPEEQMVTTVNQLRTFTPVIGLQGGDSENKFLEENSVVGEPFTMQGRKLRIESTKENPSFQDRYLKKPDPALQKQVTSLSLEAVASSFPIVKLNIGAKNQEGEMVEGLSPSDFIITEDGKSVKAIMENNQRTPKILVLSDTSGSMPVEWRGEGVKTFNKNLKIGILDNFPAAIVEFWETPSSLFTWLLKASRTDFDLIVYATDGDNNDTYNEVNLDQYNSGPPALILSVKESEFSGHTTAFAKMAEVTNGKVLPAKDQERVLTEINDHVNSLDPAPYVFTYASASKGIKHKAEVVIDSGRLKQEAEYEFPDNKSGDINGIIGVYLELKIGNNSKINRTLAGWDPIYKYDSSENEKHNLNAKQLFLGGALLSVEGEGPTMAMALKDLLSAKLSNRTWGEAYMDDEIVKAKELLSQGVVYYPPELLTLMAPLQDQTSGESLTFPSGYRIGMVKNLIGIDDQKTVFSFDYLPTSNYKSIAKTTEAAFKATITKTAQLAAREASVYTESTWSLLKEKEWMSHTPLTDGWLASIGIDYYHRDRVYWNENVLRGGGFYKITDIKGGTKAYWQIHKRTGEIVGILPDGSGGGSSPSDPTVDGAAAIIDVMMSIVGIISHLSSIFGFGFVSPLGGLSLSIVAKYGVTLVKLYAIVSETIAIMDVSHLEESVRRELQILACNTAKEITFSLAGDTGAIMGGLDNIIGAMVPEDQYPFSCN